jgi:formyl-CoA transferase/CoA:oxalate CoA-transferase
MAQPLTGMRVLDLTRVMAGPYCTMMLGDMGADVVKIERPGKGDDTRPWGPPFLEGESAYYLSVNRNKRSVTVDLKDPAGREIAHRLARLGLGYDDLRAIKPDLVYCSISGFGQDGPGHRRPAYDLVVQGMSGMMSLTGAADGPPTKMGVPIADMTTGMFAAFAVASALLHRERTGEGQYIDTSMLGSQVALLVYYAVGYFATGEVPRRQGNRHQTVVPYDTFTTADGYVNLPIGNEALWARFCAAFDLPEAAADPRFASNALRMAHREPLYAAIEGALSRHTTAEVMARLDAAGVPAGPIATVDQVFAEPQTLHLGGGVA